MNDSTVPTRVAIVTGASRGLGAATAKHLAAEGRHVVCAARNEAKLNEVKVEIEAAGGTASVATCDISSQASIEELIESVFKEHGRLDILVNNAGITKDNLLLRMTDEEFDDVIQTNLRSVFIACRSALKPMMRGKWGRIINLGSVAGVVGNPGQGKLRCGEGRLGGLHQVPGQRDGRQEHHRERDRPRLHPDRHDRRPARSDQGRRQDDDRSASLGEADEIALP